MSAYAEGAKADTSAPAVAEQRVISSHTAHQALTTHAARRTRSGSTGAPTDTDRPAPSRVIPPGILDGDCPAGLKVLATPERAVLKLLVVGGTDSSMAKALGAGADEVSWCVRKLIKRVGHQTTRAGLVALALRHHLVDLPEPPHPGQLPDDVMALLWSTAAGRTFKTFAKELGVWEAERIRADLRGRLWANLHPEQPATASLTPGHTVYLTWPALAVEAGWGPI